MSKVSVHWGLRSVVASTLVYKSQGPRFNSPQRSADFKFQIATIRSLNVGPLGNIIRIPLWQLPPSYFLTPFLTPPKTHGLVTLDKGSPWHPLVVSIREWMWFPWHPLVVSIRGWPFPDRFDKGMDALAPMDFHLEGH